MKAMKDKMAMRFAEMMKVKTRPSITQEKGDQNETDGAKENPLMALLGLKAKTLDASAKQEEKKSPQKAYQK